MDELMNNIVEYAEQCRMPAYLSKNDQYRDSERASEQQIKKLQEMLPEEGKRRLEDLLSELFLMESAKMEAMCLAGFSLGQAFSRL